MKLYSAPFCSKCRTIEKYLKDLNQSFELIDASSLSQDELNSKGISQIPMLEICAGKIFYVADMPKSKLIKLIEENNV